MYSSYVSSGHSEEDQQERHRKIVDLQREIMMTESDLKKFLNEKVILEMEAKKTKKNIDTLRMSMQEWERKIRTSDQNIEMKRSEIMRLKKQLNVV